MQYFFGFFIAIMFFISFGTIIYKVFQAIERHLESIGLFSGMGWLIKQTVTLAKRMLGKNKNTGDGS